MNYIQIPLGMRDIIPEEVDKKRELGSRIESVFQKYGYREIVTPSIEFYQTYQMAFTELQDQEMYKFFDSEGNILSLRVDMTVPIARVAASKFKDEPIPLRFYYNSNVYKVRQSFGGKRSEVTDCGVELIGLDENSDLEVLMCALDTMESFNSPTYTLEIGNSDFFKTAVSLTSLDKEQSAVLASLIDNKSMVELKEYLSSLNLKPSEKSFFLQLPLLNGTEECLDQAENISFSPKLVDVISRLKQLDKQLKALGYSHFSFDLGKVPHLDYYTGIIFEGFVEGVGTSVISGGRYDRLLSLFGLDVPACGFSVKLDYLLDVLAPVSKKKIRLYYPLSKQLEAMKQAAALRKEHIVETVPYQAEDITIEEVAI